MIKNLRYFLFVFVGFSSLTLYSQPRYRVFDFRDPKLKAFSVFAQAGTANYFGDLCPTGDCYSNPKLNFGLGAGYRLNDYIFLSLNAQYYRIGGSDIEYGNVSRAKRNLSFQSDNFEVSVLGNFEFLNYNTFRYLSRKEFPVSMFLYLGFGMTSVNPKALYKGEYVPLRPLKTEGKSYGAIAAVLPIGLGIGYRVIDNLDVSLAAGYRFTSSDYLDDVSTVYADPATLGSQQAIELSDRQKEVGFEGYGPGAKRGNPSSKDGYLLVTLKVEYIFPSSFANFSSGRTMRRSKSTISAPTKQVQKKK
jgi:hypothetical protein